MRFLVRLGARRRRGWAAGAAALLLIAGHAQAQTGERDEQAVIDHYADAAQAIYGDARDGAIALDAAIAGLLAHPDADTLDKARAAWRAARIPYLQSEAYRFANSVVDEWEPRVNAWPMDEGLIDYVAPAYGASSEMNPYYALDLVANPRVRVGGREIDAAVIDKPLLRRLQQAEGVQTNVATGYHAIEFLLWGQDLNGTGPGAGDRPAADYDLQACAHGHCDRRRAYLRAASSLLVDDLSEMADDWKPQGRARAVLLAKGPAGGMAEILSGMGSLSFSEMAGERMKLGLMLHDPEDEQDCFSDNTHNSHYYDEVGVRGVWIGRYQRRDGTIIQGPSPRAYAAAIDPAAAARLDQALDAAMRRITAIKTAADSGRMAFDQMLAPDSVEGGRLIGDAMQGLVGQTRAIEGVALALHVAIGSDRADKAKRDGQ